MHAIMPSIRITLKYHRHDELKCIDGGYLFSDKASLTLYVRIFLGIHNYVPCSTSLIYVHLIIHKMYFRMNLTKICTDFRRQIITRFGSMCPELFFKIWLQKVWCLQMPYDQQIYSSPQCTATSVEINGFLASIQKTTHINSILMP